MPNLQIIVIYFLIYIANKKKRVCRKKKSNLETVAAVEAGTPVGLWLPLLTCIALQCLDLLKNSQVSDLFVCGKYEFGVEDF